jgi:hypothetical protein
MDTVARLMLESTSKTFVTLARLARTVRPASLPSELDRDPWVSAYEYATGNLSPGEHRYLFCFLLARAFSQASKQAGRLLAIAFDKVYSAAERSELSEDDWAVVSETVRSPRWWRDWDRCETLRFGVATLCHEGMIGPVEFLGCTSSDETFMALIEEVADHWWGRRFLKNVAQHSARNSPRRAAIVEYL